MCIVTTDIPRHTDETVPWTFRKTIRGVTSYVASVPPRLASLTPTLDTELSDLSRSVQRAITAFEASSGSTIAVLEPFLVRTEAIASSQIEEEFTTVDQLARVEAGRKASAKARTVYGAADALSTLVSTASTRALGLDDLLQAHRALMSEDPTESYYAGRLRPVQNWIGGPHAYPFGADYVPPQPDRVSELIHDLIAFLARKDFDPILQASIAHAQFESIHPFTDGNGRIGRALINAELRYRGVTLKTAVPIAAALAAAQKQYFQALTVYRTGNTRPITHIILESLLTATTEATFSANVLSGLPDVWRSMLHPRSGSATAKALDMLLAHPVLDAEDLIESTHVSESAAYRAIEQLEEAGILRRIIESRRNALWVAGDVLDEADHLIARISAVHTQE